MRIRWSAGAELHRDQARQSQISRLKLKQLNRKILEALALIEQFPESGKMYPAYNREDIRVLVVGEYRMAYVLIEDEAIILSFVHARSDVAHD